MKGVESTPGHILLAIVHGKFINKIIINNFLSQKCFHYVFTEDLHHRDEGYPIIIQIKQELKVEILLAFANGILYK